MSAGMSCKHAEMLTKLINKKYALSPRHISSVLLAQSTNRNMDIFFKDKQ